MIKKLAISLCLTIMILSLVGCNDKSKDNKSNNNESLYTADLIAAKGSTAIAVEAEITFNVNGSTIVAQMYKGASKDMNISKPTDDLKFYLFETVEDADNAYNYFSAQIDARDDDIKENSIYGRNKNATDIVIKEFYYKTNNLIIMRTDYIGDPGEEDKESEQNYMNSVVRHVEITDTW